VIPRPPGTLCSETGAAADAQAHQYVNYPATAPGATAYCCDVYNVGGSTALNLTEPTWNPGGGSTWPLWLASKTAGMREKVVEDAGAGTDDGPEDSGQTYFANFQVSNN